MVSFYHDEVVFTDPAFGNLKGVRAKNMWRMLCGNAQDFKLEYSQVSEHSAYWEANYTFSKTGRRIHNKIDAFFEFKDGKIIKHLDSFNIHKWASQAIGFKGWLLGGTSYFKRKLNAQTNRLLEKYEKGL